MLEVTAARVLDLQSASTYQMSQVEADAFALIEKRVALGDHSARQHMPVLSVVKSTLLIARSSIATSLTVLDVRRRT